MIILQLILLTIVVEICGGLKQGIDGGDWARTVIEIQRELAAHPIWSDDDSQSLFSELIGAAPRNFEKENFHPSKNPADDIRNYINGVRDCYNSIGMTITIVYKNQVILKEGFGFKDVEKQYPVDADTLFGIGSTSKAFASAMAALAVSEKNLEWTKAIRDYIPEFGLSNQFANERANLYDLLSHKVGLPRNDILWISGPEGTREEIISRLKYLEFDRDFRTEFEYNNWMVFIGGYLAAKSFGVSWEELITTKIFKPLNMTRTSPTAKGALELGNYALNYAGTAISGFNLLPDDINKCIDLLAPAGAIHTSANDMIHWLKFQLNLGKTESGEQLIPGPDLLETRLSHFASTRSSITGSLTETVFPASFFQISLGLGWFNTVYRGRRVMNHSGATLSHASLVVLLPDEQFGIFLSGNNLGVDTKTESLITAFAIDTLLGLPPWLNVSSACAFPCSFIPCGNETKSATSPRKVELLQKLQSLRENLPEVEKDPKVLEEYAGTYFHPTYLNMYFTWNGQGLSGKYNDFTGDVIKLAGVPGDMLYFLPDDYWKYISSVIPLPFERDATGAISSLTIPAFEPNAPPTFLKQ